MEAETLSVSIPYKGCDKQCPYCISKMTGYIEGNMEVIMKNYSKVVQMAKNARVNNVIITGKGEPVLNPALIKVALEKFYDFPIELQTNGIKLKSSGKRMLEDFFSRGLNTLALSVDKLSDVVELYDLIEFANEIGLVTKILIIVTDELRGLTLDDFIEDCNARQFTIRKATAPDWGFDNTNLAVYTKEWIRKNVGYESKSFIETSVRKLMKDGRLIRKLSYGPFVYDYCGVSCVYFNRCIQESSGDGDVRNLIFQEDGHLYYFWNSMASIIF
ncbi:hypothetical protein LCGC14_1002610 [marine sediment metagenome]|uniref:Radical SAM core domain-containing protein n=1 Tax=marine sediment metagenome TaxID=412755 RepID=A0A0F9R8S9_9ZZZZ